MTRRHRATTTTLPTLAAALGLLAVGAAPAAAEPAVGVLEGSNVLVSFDTATPGTFSSLRQITGLPLGERIRGVDFRHIPSKEVDPQPPPRLFALSVEQQTTDDLVRLYTVDMGTGVATRVGAGSITVPHAANYAMDFNPTSDRVRVVNSADDNFRINPSNGARSDLPVEDADLTPGPVVVTAAAYDRVNIPAPPVIAANTTLYAINAAAASLITIGSINQTPNSPNGGQTAVVGSLSIGALTPGTNGELNLDIAPGGTAYLTANASDGSALYVVNLGTGGATLVGRLPAALNAFAVVPGASVVQFDAATATVGEGGTASVTVSRAGGVGETATVRYATADGSANSADYTPQSDTLAFAPGETSKTIAVPTTQDTTDESDETVTLSLSEPSLQATLGPQTTATLTITDDDASTPTPTPSPSPQPTQPDLTAPTATLTGLPSTTTRAKFLKGLKLALTPNEPAAIEAELLATATGARISAYELRLASKSLPLAPGRRTITLKPSRRLVGSPRRTVKVRVRVTLTDASRNRRTLTKTISVRRR